MDSYDLEIIQGATYNLTLLLKDEDQNPLDLTPYEISGYLKYRYSDTTSPVSLNPTRIAPYESGIISLSIPASGSSSLPVGYVFYDVEAYHTGLGTVDKLLMGKASVYPEIVY